MPEGSEIKWLRVSVARTRNFMYFQQNENGIFIKTCALLKIYKRFLLTPHSLSPWAQHFRYFQQHTKRQGRLFKSIFLLFTFLLQPYRSCDSCAFQLSFLFYHPSGIKKDFSDKHFCLFFFSAIIAFSSLLFYFFCVFCCGWEFWAFSTAIMRLLKYILISM